jgi:hypothetical protein
MKNLTLSALMLLAPLACRAADTATPLDVKPGLWESTVNLQANGMPVIPEATLAQLPPEQRAKIEAAMKSANTSQSCRTAESLSKPLSFGDRPGSNCTRTLTSSSSGGMEFHMECVNGKVKTSGDGHVQVVSPELLKGEVTMSATMPDGRTTNSKIVFSSKWLGPDCGSVKPK